MADSDTEKQTSVADVAGGNPLRATASALVDPQKLSRPARVVLGTVLTTVFILVAYLDYWVGREISVSLFYLFPVAVAAWVWGRRAGLGIALIAALSWGGLNQLSGQSYSHWAIPYWNMLLRALNFVVVSQLFGGLQALLARERAEADTDSLTGIFNRSGWFEAAEIALARCRRGGQCLAVAYIDLDNFKRVNDGLGHEEGDRVLANVAHTIRSTIRRSDIAARVGGDEFVVFFPDASVENVSVMGEKLQAALNTVMAEHEWPVGFSVGIAYYKTAPASVQETISRADSIMYTVKREGKSAMRLVE